MPMVDLESVFERLSGFPIRIFEEGELVLPQGGRTGQLLFLLQGAIDVIKDGWHIARIAKPGAVFGDMAVLRDQPHSADVVAIERSSVFVVSDAASFLRTEPLIALYVAVVQSGRLDAANRSVIAARSQLVANGKQDPGFVAILDEIGAALHRVA
jgi:CRP/FNR family transcriptional regulator, cyclic AMP receptor protein